MGTNYYFRVNKDITDRDSEIHIGKRSAAGFWCKKCRLPLISTSKHSGLHYFKDKNDYPSSSVLYGSDGIHEGEPVKSSSICYVCGKQGASSCSFLWAIPLDVFREKKKDYKIVDEYDEVIKDFSKIMESCSWHRFHMTGKDFS